MQSFEKKNGFLKAKHHLSLWYFTVSSNIFLLSLLQVQIIQNYLYKEINN